MKGKGIKSTSGITLIALVITIILLVILATISINAVFGDNGLITKAQKAGEVYEEKQEWERLELVKGEVAFDSTQSGNTGKYTVEDYVNRLEEKGMVAQKPQGGTGTDPQIVITDKGWMVNISQDGERNVKFSIEKYQGVIVIPMRITGMTLTPSLKNMTIGVSITTSNTDGATYKYYYKKAVEGDGAYKEVYSGGKSYTITGNEAGATALEADVIYTIKVVAERGSGANKETTELTKNVEIKSVPLAQGAIEYRDLTWSNGKASVKVVKTISGNYTMKYEVDKAVGTDIGKTGITSGETISNLEVGDVVLVRLIDSDGVEGQPADLTITDTQDPEGANIGIFHTSDNNTEITEGGTVKVTVNIEDKQSGINLSESRWIITTDDKSIGTNASTYQVAGVSGTFTGATQSNGGTKAEKEIEITMPSGITEDTTYYLHILTVDKAGNKIETISTKTITEKAPVRVTSLGLKIIEKDGTAISPEEIVTSGSEVTIKSGKTIKLDVDYNLGGTAPSDSLKGVTWNITSGVTSYVTLDTTTGVVTGVAEIPSGTIVEVTATSTSNTSVSASCKIKVSTASLDYSWTELEEIAKAISAASDSDIPINSSGPIVYNPTTRMARVDETAETGEKKLEIGDTTYIRFKDDGETDSTDYIVRIIGFKHDLLAEDGYNTGYTPVPFSSTETKKYAGITFDTAYCIKYGVGMNPPEVNAWTTTNMRETVLPAYITKFEDSTYGTAGLNMKKVYKETWTTGMGNYSENVENELWLFSGIEIFGGSGSPTEGTQYPYYATHGKRKYYFRGWGENDYVSCAWWLRSPLSTECFQLVNSAGRSEMEYWNYNYGVAPGFSI